MRQILTVALLFLSCAASAASSQAPEDSSTAHVPGIDSKLTVEQRQFAEELGKRMAEEASKALARPEAGSALEYADRMRRKADDIANQAISAERSKILRFLGINPDGNSALYYFVSWSMPLELLRAYMVEAMWAGGTLVFRGVPDGEDLREFVTKKLYYLVYGKGASANISIDPRLFEGYQVQVVPAIVFTTDRSNFTCAGQKQTQWIYKDQTLAFPSCELKDPNLYWKVSGAVTTDWALRKIIEAGGEGARVHLEALAKGASGTPGKTQKPFVGQWREVLTPEERQAYQDALRRQE